MAKKFKKNFMRFCSLLLLPGISTLALFVVALLPSLFSSSSYSHISCQISILILSFEQCGIILFGCQMLSFRFDNELTDSLAFQRAKLILAFVDLLWSHCILDAITLSGNSPFYFSPTLLGRCC